MRNNSPANSYAMAVERRRHHDAGHRATDQKVLQRHTEQVQCGQQHQEIAQEDDQHPRGGCGGGAGVARGSGHTGGHRSGRRDAQDGERGGKIGSDHSWPPIWQCAAARADAVRDKHDQREDAAAETAAELWAHGVQDLPG
jgi:hypothetical protein